MPTNTVRLHRVIRTSPERVYRAFLSADAMAGVINFRQSDGRLRFDVSQAAAERGDFKLSSRLLSVAIVQPGQN